MTSITSYTLFESLLFFQSLATLDGRPANFGAISDTLKNNRFVSENPEFNVERLSPSALEQFYLKLIKEEVDAQNARKGGLNGQAQDVDSSKKRKITTSPPLALDDASLHSRVVPRLVAQLYARYRNLAITQIREDEKQYQAVKRESQLRNNHAQPPSQANTASPKPHDRSLPANPYDASSNFTGPVFHNVPGTPNNAAQPTVPSPAITQKGPFISDNGHRGPVTAHHVPPGTTLPSTHGSAHDFKQERPPQPAPRPQPRPPPGPMMGILQPHPIGQAPPNVRSAQAQQMQGHPNAGYGHPMPPGQPGYPYGRMPATGFTPQDPQQLAPKAQGPPQKAGTPHPPHLQTPVNQDAKSPGYSPAQQSPGPHSTTPQPNNAPHKQHAGHQAPPAIPQGPHLAPKIPASSQHSWQLAPATPRPVTTPAGTPSIPTGEPNRPSQTPRPQPQVQVQIPVSKAEPTPEPRPQSNPPTNQAVKPLPSQVRPRFSTPVSTPQTTRKFNKSLQLDTSASTVTPWKMSVGPPGSPRSPSRPGSANVSPISSRETSPAPNPKHSRLDLRGGQGSAARTPTTRKSEDHGSELKVPPASTNRSSRRTRAGSTASSNVAPSSARSRSQSVISHIEERSDAGSVRTRKIKHEQPSTPAGIPADSDMEMRTTGRRRRGTLADDSGTATRHSSKRKRGDIFDAEETPPARGISIHLNMNQVMTTKNFPRTAQTILQDIATHKHASLFAKPLTERDAPGYKDLIYRPQDLKTIKSAISQGSRAVATATEANNTPVAHPADSGTGSPGPNGLSTGLSTGGTGTPKNAPIILPKTLDLIPPRAIVNSAQLEKELIRIFANAVMFNPTPDRERIFGPLPGRGCGYDGGIGDVPGSWTQVAAAAAADAEAEENVKQSFLERGIIDDTRAMAEDVEKAVDSWRAAERAVDDR